MELVLDLRVARRPDGRWGPKSAGMATSQREIQ